MDYSRRGIVLKQRALRSTTKKLNSKLWITVFRFVIIAIVALAISCVMAGLGAFNALIDTAPEVHIQDLEPSSFSSVSYYSDGTVAQVFAGAEANRKYVTIDQIPLCVQHAFVALEDERFYIHSGIDMRGIFRAGISVAKTGGLGFGGSTLTQQLIKNRIFNGGDEDNMLDKIERKIQEQYLALELETVVSKDQILEYYLNYVNMGNGAFGIQKAAENYFGKDVEDLTISEAAAIAPTVLAPTSQNPVTHPDNNRKRRQSCLEKMLELGYCTEEEYEEACADDVYARIAEHNQHRTVSSLGTYTYFTDEVVEQVLEDLQTECGYTYDEAQKLLYYSGISIYTTQDREAQAIVDKYYTDDSYFPAYGFSDSAGSCYELDYALSVYKPDGSIIHYQLSHLLKYFSDYYDVEHLYYHDDDTLKGINKLCLSPDDINAKIDEFKAAMMEEGDTCIERKSLTPQPQSSFTLIDQSTGEVVALYGGRGEKNGSRTLNRATNTTRLVGSTYKVLAAFLPAIDTGKMTLATVFDDSPYFYPGERVDKEVINWYDINSFRGLQSVRNGIASSLNVVAVKALASVGIKEGPKLAFDYLQKLGFSTLVESRNGMSDIGLAIALGGLTDGVSNIELCAAYGSIGNNGIYQKPIYYTKILDHDGNVLISKKSKSTQVMKTSTAWLLTSAMHSTITDGTGWRVDFTDQVKQYICGKTGTTTNNNDLWFVGFTPYYTASVWTGYDNNFNQINKTYQQFLWKNIMCDVHRAKALPYKEFDKPDSIVTAKICTKCGKLAVDGLCDKAEGGSCVKTEYFAKGTVPTETCDCHIRVDICKKSKDIATDYCPASQRKSVVLLKKSEDYEFTPSQLKYMTEKRKYTFPIKTYDTPYLYDPTDLCTVHLPEGLVVDEQGNIVSEYLLEYEERERLRLEREEEEKEKNAPKATIEEVEEFELPSLDERETDVY